MRLVAEREVRYRLGTKSFKIVTVLVAVVAAGVVVALHLHHGHKATYRVAVVGATPPGVAAALLAIEPQLNAKLTVTTTAEISARNQMHHNQLDVAIIDGQRIVARRNPNASLISLLEQVVAQARIADRLTAAGVGADDANTLLNPGPLPVEVLEPKPATRVADKPAALAAVLLIYMPLLIYGGTVAVGVVEEKSTRVSEILLGAVRPHELMAGKVIGIGLAATAQFLCIGTAAAATALAVGSLHIPHGTALTFASVPMWFVLDYGLYSCAFAATAASASRPEDAAVVTLPVNLVVIASFFASAYTVASPDSTAARTMSFIPPLTPMVMLPRAAVGHVAAWEIPLAVLLVVASTWLLVRLAGRVYAGAIVSSGRRVKLADALRASRRQRRDNAAP